MNAFGFLLNQIKTGALPIAVDSSEKNVSLRLENVRTKITVFKANYSAID